MKISKIFRILNILVYVSILLCVASFFISAGTKQSIDSVTYSSRIPLGLKAFELFDRDYHYRELAARITKVSKTPEEKAIAIFNWTCGNIKTDFPKEWPVVDDHVWNIVVRGYGVGSQTADVFTTLCAYAGLPAMVYRVHAKEGGSKIILSLVKAGDKYYIFDTIRRNIFFDRSGRLATLNEIIKDPSIVSLAANKPVVAGVAYEDYFKDLKPVGRLGTTRPELQMPFKRLWHEFLKPFAQKKR